MTYRWRYQDDTGSEVGGPQVVFDEQTDAEDWLTASWQELLATGIGQVTLLHGELEVYGPMSLHAA